MTYVNQKEVIGSKPRFHIARHFRVGYLRLNAIPCGRDVAIHVEDVGGPRVVIEGYIIRRAVVMMRHEVTVGTGQGIFETNFYISALLSANKPTT